MSEASNEGAGAPAKERLLRSASRLFATKGFEGASIREICKDAATGINMVHHYFGNKEGLLEAVLASFDQNVFGTPLRLLQDPPRTRDDLSARLRLVFETALEAYLKERNALMVAIRVQAELPGAAAFQSSFVEFLKAGQESGLVRTDLKPGLISGAILDRLLNQALFAPWIKKSIGVDVERDEKYRRQWSEANLDLFLNGLLSPGEGSGE